MLLQRYLEALDVQRRSDTMALEDPDRPVEIARVVHSFDPCNDCAVQVITADGRVRKFIV